MDQDQDDSSVISTAKMNVLIESTSDDNSNNNNNNNNRNNISNKRPRHDVSPKFKGVVSQQNGHWGAQIYANHQRIWLGTFKSEKEAAMAYDSASIKLRSGDNYTASHRNFPCTKSTSEEHNFQNQYTTEVVLNMIRDGSYPSKFAAFLRALSQKEVGISLKRTRVHGYGSKFSCAQLFQKELTPSDVGKLNRLVIPKKYAVKYFPCISDNQNADELTYNNNDNNDGGVNTEDIELSFYDRMIKLWKFRYCYWKSSQSFVFTRGWNRFVKEKKLKANDVIMFYTCEEGDKEDNHQKGNAFCLIDVIYSSSGNVQDQGKSCNNFPGHHHDQDHVNYQFNEMQMELENHLGSVFGSKNSIEEGTYHDHKEEERCQEKKILNGLSACQSVGEKGFKLFGVHIK